MFMEIERRAVKLPILLRNGGGEETDRKNAIALTRYAILRAPSYCAGVAHRRTQEWLEQTWAKVMCARHGCACVRAVVVTFLANDWYFPELSPNASEMRLAAKLHSAGVQLPFDALVRIFRETRPEYRSRLVQDICNVPAFEFELWI